MPDFSAHNPAAVLNQTSTLMLTNLRYNYGIESRSFSSPGFDCKIDIDQSFAIVTAYVVT